VSRKCASFQSDGLVRIGPEEATASATPMSGSAGTPTSIKVGYTARVTEVEHALLNVGDAFGTLRVSVISVVSGTVNAETLDPVAESRSLRSLALPGGAAFAVLRGLQRSARAPPGEPADAA
jgi:hypothetical protein